VMLGHMAPFAMLPGLLVRLLSHGGAAVDVFFILSGMVIVQSLESFGWHANGFLIARIARTYPVYLVMLALAVPVQALPTDLARLPWIGDDTLACDIWSVGWPHAWAIELATHLTMTHGLLPDSAVPGGWISFLGSAWSLSTEWQFYLLALWLGRLTGPRRMTQAFLLLAVAGLLWQQAAPPALSFSRAFLPNKAQFFALGIASAGLLRGETIRRYGTVLLLTLAICAVQQRAEKLLPPLLWTLCLAAQLRPDLAVLRPLASLLRARWLLWLGTLSYCIYLANEPLQKLLGLLLAACVAGNGVAFTAIWLPGAVLLPVLLSIALHRWVETPALRRGRRYARDLAGATGPKPQPRPVVIR
jgi:peptidoglycan/LPS O-acetylase OafA/YrhL